MHLQNTLLVGGVYQPLQILGAGGFGSVYLARNTRNNTLVAIKFLTQGNPDAYARFVREAGLLWKNLHNQFVVRLIDHNLGHAPPYIVMEYCEHGSLRKWVGTGRPWQDVAAALMHAIQGLSIIHNAGGFHRDIKPDNLLSAAHPAEANKVIIKVSDFGLARTPDASDGPMTRSPHGTEGYIAPEVLAGSPYTSAADIYSLGVTAAELLTGARGGQRLGQTKMPEQLRKLIRAMISPVPEARATAQQVASIIGSLFASQNVIAVEEDTDSGVGAFLFGSLLFTGAMVALAALANSGTDGAPNGGGAK